MRGRITYFTSVADTPKMSPLSAVDFWILPDVYVPTLALGEQQDIYLYWGYETQDPYYKDQRNVSRSAAGVVDISVYLSTTGFKFSIPDVLHDRAAAVNEYAVMQALNNELMIGTTVLWYPDYDNYPSEYYACVAEARLNPKRVGKQYRWVFSFDLAVLPAVQMPSTVPVFVLA